MAGCNRNAKTDSKALLTENDVYANVAYKNPIDSIVHCSENPIEMEEVYYFLFDNPDFVKESPNEGYYYDPDDDEYVLLWKDCGNFRIYSIPYISPHATLAFNFIQYKDNGEIDTIMLENIVGNVPMKDFQEVESTDGKKHYVLKSRVFVCHQGYVQTEIVTSFSVQNGRLVKDKLFQTATNSYDYIEVNNGQGYIPLDYNNLCLIQFTGFEDDDKSPSVVISEISEMGWPTGFGLKYHWNGSCFKYEGKCHYDANDM